jgi:hypothetical protein
MYHKAAVRYPQILTIALTSVQEYSQLRMNNSRKKPQSKSKSKAPAKKAKRTQKVATKKRTPHRTGSWLKKMAP